MLENFFELMKISPALFWGFSFVLGLVIGSFLNVVIYRYPIMLENMWRREADFFLSTQNPVIGVVPTADSISSADSISTTEEQAAADATPAFNLITPRSTCPHCKTEIKAWDNIPVLSYILLLQGKCRQCKAIISPRYPIIELATGFLTLVVAYQFGVSWQSLAVMMITWVLIALSMIDFDHKILPDDFTLPLMWAGMLFNTSSFAFITLSQSVWGAALGYFSLWSVFWLFKLMTGKDGMGYGDFKLLAALGAWLGWQAIPGIILYSSLVGSAIGVVLIFILKRDKNNGIPFGPYLAVSGWLVLVCKEMLPFYSMWVF